jgi:tetratricopeptide (TPR) repeat protein
MLLVEQSVAVAMETADAVVVLEAGRVALRGPAAERAGMDRSLLLSRCAEAAYAAGDTARAAQLVRQAMPLVDEARQPQRLGLLHEQLARCLRMLGDPGALGAQQEAVRLVAPEPSPERARVLGSPAQHLVLVDRFAEARAPAAEAVAIAAQVGARTDAASVGLPLARAALELGLGDLDAAEARLRAVRRLLPAPIPEAQKAGPLFCGLAELALWRGDVEQARELVTQAVPLVEADPRYAAPLYALGVRVEADRTALARARKLTRACTSVRNLPKARRFRCQAGTAPGGAQGHDLRHGSAGRGRCLRRSGHKALPQRGQLWADLLEQVHGGHAAHSGELRGLYQPVPLDKCRCNRNPNPPPPDPAGPSAQGSDTSDASSLNSVPTGGAGRRPAG